MGGKGFEAVASNSVLVQWGTNLEKAEWITAGLKRLELPEKGARPQGVTEKRFVKNTSQTHRAVLLWTPDSVVGSEVTYRTGITHRRYSPPSADVLFREHSATQRSARGRKFALHRKSESAHTSALKTGHWGGSKVSFHLPSGGNNKTIRMVQQEVEGLRRSTLGQNLT